jgi:hypothetical protein
MGGYNSGRHGWRGVIESRKRLDIRQCRSWLRPGRLGTYSWNQDGEPCGSVSYSVLDGALELRYTITDGEDEGQSIRVTIPVRRFPCRYGGERLYWSCPNCFRRCEVVVMASHGRHWGCQRCLRLRYQSQGLARSDRVQQRADRLCARAGIEDESGIVHKHKWMRWQAYDRLMNRAAELNAVADSAFALRAARLFCK